MSKSGTANNAPIRAERKVKNTILERWHAIVARMGAAVAVRMPDGKAARTFAEIDAEAGRIAAGLGHVPAGSVVSVQALNTAAWPGLVLGIWKAGGCVLLIDQTANDASRDEAMWDLWKVAGLESVERRQIAVQRTFADFADFWTSCMKSPTLGPTIAALPPADLAALKARVRARLPEESDGRIIHNARANAIKGRVPK